MSFLAQEQRLQSLMSIPSSCRCQRLRQCRRTLDNLLKKYEEITHVAMQEEDVPEEVRSIRSKSVKVYLRPSATRREQELQDQAKRIQDLQQVAQQDYQKKQVRAPTPIQKKIQDAIAAVGKR